MTKFASHRLNLILEMCENKLNLLEINLILQRFYNYFVQ